MIPEQNKEDLSSTSVSLLLLCDAGFHVDYDHAAEMEGKAHTGTATLAVIILRKFSQRHSKLLTKMLTEGSNDNSKGTNKQIVTQIELHLPEGAHDYQFGSELQSMTYSEEWSLCVQLQDEVNLQKGGL